MEQEIGIKIQDNLFIAKTKSEQNPLVKLSKSSTSIARPMKMMLGRFNAKPLNQKKVEAD